MGCHGYYVDTTGENTAAIKAYMQNQMKEDLEYDQMSLVWYIDPFTGEPVKKRNKLLGVAIGSQSKPANPFWGCCKCATAGRLSVRLAGACGLIAPFSGGANPG